MEEKSIDEKLKDLILSQYKNMQAFATATGLNYQTLVSIMNRGVHKSNVNNVIKICQTLGISTDELAQDRIVFVTRSDDRIDLDGAKEIVDHVKRNLLDCLLSINGDPFTADDFDMLMDGIELTVELIRRKKNR